MFKFNEFKRARTSRSMRKYWKRNIIVELKIYLEGFLFHSFDQSQHLPLRSFQINNTFLSDADNRFSIFGGRRAEKNCELPSLFRRNTGAANSSVSQQLIDNDEGQRIRTHAELLMPLLFETWMEVRPAKLRNESSSFYSDDADICLSNEAAYTLKTIIDVICELLEMMKIWNKEVNNADLTDWFRKNYGQQFCSLFMVGFPYSQGDGFKGILKRLPSMWTNRYWNMRFSITGSKRKSKGMATEQDVFEAGGQKCHQQNLSISFVFACLVPELSPQNAPLADKILQFLNSTKSFENAVFFNNKKNISVNSNFCFQIICSASTPVIRKSLLLWLNCCEQFWLKMVPPGIDRCRHQSLTCSHWLFRTTTRANFQKTSLRKYSICCVAS